MDIHIIVKLKSSYEAWHKLFVDDADNRSKICDESKTLVGKANDATALVTLFDVDMPAMGAMMEDPDFQKLIEDYVIEHIPFTITPLAPPEQRDLFKVHFELHHPPQDVVFHQRSTFYRERFRTKKNEPEKIDN